MAKVKFSRTEKILRFVDCEIDIPDQVLEDGQVYIKEYIRDHQDKTNDIGINHEDIQEYLYIDIVASSLPGIESVSESDMEAPF